MRIGRYGLGRMGSNMARRPKMIHDGIEYGPMQAYAEVFDILRHAGEAAPAEGAR